MTHHIKVVDGRYQIYAVINGRYSLNVGPRCETPREANAFVDTLDGTHISPLRSSETRPVTR